VLFWRQSDKTMARSVLLEKLDALHFLSYFSPNEICGEYLIFLTGQKEMNFVDAKVLIGSNILLKALLGR
jgi:hypothetical protein